MSKPPAIAVSETSADEDRISEHFVSELISQRFDRLDEYNHAMEPQHSDESDSDTADDERLMRSFEDMMRDSSSLTGNSIPSPSLMLMGPEPQPLGTNDAPTCSHFGELNENCNSTNLFKNNKFSSHEESDFTRTCPLEFIKNNRKDKKMFKLFVNERFQSHDSKSKKIKHKVEAIINEHHAALINMVNNDLDICRTNLEQQTRKSRRLFQSFINKLIDENYHIAYSEIEFTTMIDKKLLDEFEKLRNRVNKHLHQEKYSLREVFFKSVKDSRATIERHFNFVDFLFIFTTILENKIEIVNNCVRNDMEQLIGAQRKEIRNFVSNRVLLPNHEQWTPFGNKFLGTSRAKTGIYNETISINNNFHDAHELLSNFESLRATKPAEISVKSVSKQNKQLIRIFDEFYGGSENSNQEQDPYLKFLTHQLALLNGSENTTLIEPLETTKTISKVKPKKSTGKNGVSTKNGGNFLQVDVHKKTNKKGGDQIMASIQSRMQSERRVLRAKRIKQSKANSTLDTVESLPIPPITLPEIPTSPNMSNETNPTPNVQLISKSNENNSSSSAENESCTVTLGGKRKTKPEKIFPGTSQSVSLRSDNIRDEIQPLTEREDVNNNFIHSCKIDTCEPKQDINNHTTEPEQGVYSPTIKLQENEKHVINDIIKDEEIKNIVLQDIDKKLTEIENSVADMYQKLVVANIEYQKLMRYKEEINRSQPRDRTNETALIDNNPVEENNILPM